MKISLITIHVFLTVFSFGQSYSTDDKKAIRLFEQAKQASGNYLYGKSLIMLNDALALDPDFLEAYLMKSDIYQEMDSVSLQIKSLESAIRINPTKFPKMYYSIGNAYYRSGYYQKAVESFRKYLSFAGEKEIGRAHV